MTAAATTTSTPASLSAAFTALVPRLSPTLRKGNCGRVAVIGGCQEYTGAPYFSALASLKLGCDLSHVICDVNAGPVIKGYSPELIVHPYLRTSDSLETRPIERVAPLLERFHCVVIGPGMGRDPIMLELAECILDQVKRRSLPVVVDADALYLVSQKPDLIRGYPLAVLTPNAVEFARLCAAVGVSDQVEGGAHRLAKALGVSVVQKGTVDVIAVEGKAAEVECREPGGLRRFGGQGDVLTGSLATFLAWAVLAKERSESDSLPDLTPPLWAACAVTRHASWLAFDNHGRGTMTGHVLEELTRSFEHLGFEVSSGKVSEM
ncbi:H-hydrate dehydratase [Catenaria anguillulae PL171]|uniref:ATP-dependent (S)-NAD(P)H-hydrate dehydratase n=1 Tax=Catenaria anguillulae PL171 TaxID=765915 RepID=A0A1Y2I220_9FUNG|nr:H-hydrate dehydratase [Catenaria anguillulae PL171]